MKTCFNQIAPLCLLLSIVSCAHKAGNLRAPISVSADELKKLHENCTHGNPFACIDLGDWYQDQKDYVASYDFYLKGCDLSLGASCSQASIIQKTFLNPEDRTGERPIQLANKACTLNDTLGCYNTACYYCLYQNNKTQAVEYLKKAVQTGYRDLSSLNLDPDLACLRGTPEWNAFLKTIPPESHPAHRVSRNYLFSAGLGGSFLPVPGFFLQGSPGYIEMHDEAGSQVILYGVHVPMSKLVQQFKDHLAAMKGNASSFEVIEEKESSMNEYANYFSKVKVTQGGLDFFLLNYFIGTDEYAVQGTAHYLSSYQDTYGEWVMRSVTSPVLSPWQLPGESLVPYTQNFGTLGLKYAGSYLDQFHYNQTGSLKDPAALPHLIFTPVKYSKESEKFSPETAAKVFNAALEPGFAKVVRIDQIKHQHLKNKMDLYSIQVDAESREIAKKVSVQMFLIDFHEKIQESELGLSGIILTEVADKKKRESIMKVVREMKLKKKVMTELKNHTEKLEPKKDAPKPPVGSGDTSVG